MFVWLRSNWETSIFFVSFQKVKMSEGSESLDLWATPPVELFLKVYLFNVTNREAFLAGKEKLRVQEVGPYVYR